jgi:hypothetical protein
MTKSGTPGNWGQLKGEGGHPHGGERRPEGAGAETDLLGDQQVIRTILPVLNPPWRRHIR